MLILRLLWIKTRGLNYDCRLSVLMLRRLLLGLRIISIPDMILKTINKILLHHTILRLHSCSTPSNQLRLPSFHHPLHSTPPHHQNLPLSHLKPNVRSLDLNRAIHVLQRPHKHRPVHIRLLHHRYAPSRIVQSLQAGRKLREERRVVMRMKQRLVPSSVLQLRGRKALSLVRIIEIKQRVFVNLSTSTILACTRFIRE